MDEIHVVGAAIINGTMVLAAQRSSKMNSPLKWEFVGGKVEKGETHKQALEREVYEELGIRIETKRHIATGTSFTKDKKIILDVYECCIKEGIPQAKEHAQLKWIQIAEIRNYEWAEADIPACKELIRYRHS